MKKHLLALGTFLTTLTMLGCSGTPENSTGLGSGQQENTLGTEAIAGDSSSSSSAPISLPDAQTVRIGSINWYVSYDDALADAKRTNRPVWLHFGENPG